MHVEHRREVFDVHNHVVLENPSNATDLSKVIAKDFRRRKTMMRRYGITKGAIMPALRFERRRGEADIPVVNDLVAQYREEHADRFPVALGTLDPMNGTKSCSIEFERVVHKLRLNGLVWHHRYQGTAIDDPKMWPLLTLNKEYGLPLFIHVFAESTMESCARLEHLVSSFPDFDFVAVDAFSAPTQSILVTQMCERLNNLSVETGSLYSVGTLVDKFVERLGSDRVIFGTDMYVDPFIFNTPFPLFEINESRGLSKRDKQNILWRNAYRLFKLRHR